MGERIYLLRDGGVWGERFFWVGGFLWPFWKELGGTVSERGYGDVVGDEDMRL